MAVQAIMPFVHCTVDVGAATKAYHVVWKFPDGFLNVLIHVGKFWQNRPVLVVLKMKFKQRF